MKFSWQLQKESLYHYQFTFQYFEGQIVLPFRKSQVCIYIFITFFMHKLSFTLFRFNHYFPFYSISRKEKSYLNLNKVSSLFLLGLVTHLTELQQKLRLSLHSRLQNDSTRTSDYRWTKQQRNVHFANGPSGGYPWHFKSNKGIITKFK